MTDGAEATYWTLIAEAAQRQPNRSLLADDYGRSLSTRQLHDAACATAAAFAQRGIGAGTVVSWQLPTTLETVVVMAALTRLGAVQNPIIPILREREVGFITGQLATEFLVVPELWRGFEHGELARSLASDRGFEVITVDLATPPRRWPSRRTARPSWVRRRRSSSRSWMPNGPMVIGRSSVRCGVASPVAHPSPPNWGGRSAKHSACPASLTPGG
jgi:acyl-CoA synthetase (AMP-forming)/AMP-acid ligase II